MELEVKKGNITFNRVLSPLDELAIPFSQALANHGIGHVYLSGYVAILFGRNRSSENIDVVCRKVPYDTFLSFWDSLGPQIECLIPSDPNAAYEDYLLRQTALRFTWTGTVIPNIEMKFEKDPLQKEALDDLLIVTVNGSDLPISPLEQQIAYKLFMGSDKDNEDARFLYQLFNEHLDKNRLTYLLDILKVERKNAVDILGEML